MHKEILGSIQVMEHRFFGNGKKFRLVFTRDRVIGVKTDSERNALVGFMDEESGRIDRRDVLAADPDNFDIPYIQVREVRIKKSGVTLSVSGKVGDMTIDTFERTYEFDIEAGQEYTGCMKLLDSIFEHKLTNLSPDAVVKYCPECGEEYQQWVTTCPDCGVELTDEPPEFEEEEEPPVFADMVELHDIPGVSGAPDDTMVSIARAPSSIVAHMWKGLLDEQDIPCMIGGPYSNHTGRAWGERANEDGIDILVLVHDGKRAYEILEPFLDV